MTPVGDVSTLQSVMEHVHNWFPHNFATGYFSVKDGSLEQGRLFLQDGQYFRIVGSVFNDGLHQWPGDDLTDEVFDGEVWALAVPKAVQDLAIEIKDWCTKYGDVAGPYTSESFGGYSYTRGTSSDGTAIGWQDAFRERLNRWRKLP